MKNTKGERKEIQTIMEGYRTSNDGMEHTFYLDKMEDLLKQTALKSREEEKELEKNRAIIIMQEFINKKGEDYPIGKYLDMLCVLNQNITKDKEK